MALLQSAALRISLVVIPAFADVDTEALRTECTLKISAFIPDFVSIFFSHLARVHEVTALCGFITAMNNCDSLPLNLSVRSS